MLVGFPGAGKSTLAKIFESNGYKIHSPDLIRNELDIHEINRTKEILNITYDNILRDIKSNKNLVYDSTNLTKQRRLAILRKIKSYNCYKICIVLNTPIIICKQRNSIRKNFSKVTNEIYDKMESIYQIPTESEGWNKIIFI